MTLPTTPQNLLFNVFLGIAGGKSAGEQLIPYDPTEDTKKMLLIRFWDIFSNDFQANFRPDAPPGHPWDLKLES